MSVYNEDGETRFSKLFITKNGLSEKPPTEENRMSEHDAGILADAILDLLYPKAST